MKKIRILHIEDWFHPEMGYQLNYFAKYHSEKFEFIILTSDSLGNWSLGNSQLVAMDRKYEHDFNVRIYRLPIGKRKKTKHFLWLKGLIHKIQKIFPDIIYVHGIETYTSVRILMKKRILKKCTVVSDTHTLLSQFNNSFLFRLYFLFFKNYVIANINQYKIKVFATAPENHKILADNYGVSQELIENSPIGVDPNVFYFDNEARRKLRDKFEISSDSIILIYSGKFNFSKKPHLILESLKLIENRIENKLDLVFIGPKEPYYFKTYFNCKIDNSNIRIHILDAISNDCLYQYYSMADFAVFPNESTLSALDAQLCNLPVIMEEDSTNLLRLKMGGLLYEKNNLVHLAKQIFKLYNNKNLRNNLAIRGKRYVLDNFDYRKIVQEVENVILNCYLYE